MIIATTQIAGQHTISLTQNTRTGRCYLNYGAEEEEFLSVCNAVEAYLTAVRNAEKIAGWHYDD